MPRRATTTMSWSCRLRAGPATGFSLHSTGIRRNGDGPGRIGSIDDIDLAAWQDVALATRSRAS